MKKLFLISVLFIAAALPAQVVRPAQPGTKTISVPDRNGSTLKTDTTPHRVVTNPAINGGNRPVKTTLTPAALKDIAALPNLKWFTRYVATDPDVKPPVWAEDYSSGELKYTTNKGQPAQWQSEFVWYGVPRDAANAKVEIASMPFSSDGSPGLLETITVPRSAADSVKFTLGYKENPAKRSNLSSLRTNPGYTSALAALRSLVSMGTYYVRLTPLDVNGKAISKPGNTIRVVPDFISFPAPPVPTSEDSLQSDYEITSVKYIQMHYPEQQFAQCIVVTGYNDGIKTGPMGNTWADQMVSSFKQAFPVGTIICPSPPKQKSWYEEAYDNVTNAAAIAINGASKVYNETKDYLKKKFSEYMCNYDPVVSANKKMIEQTGMDKKTIDDGCNAATGAAFEIAMTYAGMPPSIPNYDEMCRLAKGQIVEMLVQAAVEKTEMPCDEFCRKQIEAGLDKMIEESSKKNLQNGGFFNYKPDPRGQYRLPYVEIEVTRKRNTQKGKHLITKLNFTPIVEKKLSQKDINGNPYTVFISSSDLYENIQLPVPYLSNVGDKIKLVGVLTPRMAFIVSNCTDKKITGIDKHQHLCLGWNTIELNGDDPKNSSGYSMMVDNAVINVNPAGKIKLAAGVTTKFIHHL